MSVKASYLLIFIFLLGVLHPGNKLFCQEAEIPEKPKIRFVTVNPENGYNEIEWNASLSEDIINYEVYSLDLSESKPKGTLIGTLPASSLSYTDTSAEEESRIYTIVAVNKFNNRSLLEGDYHKAIRLDVVYDSCSSEIILDWDNYIGWGNGLSGYRIMYKGPGEETFSRLDRLDSARLSFVQQDIIENEQYEYYIEAFNNQGYTSKSNLKRYYTYMPDAPSYLAIDYVSVLDEQNVEIVFTADISGILDDFRVLRSNSKEGNFQVVKSYFDVDNPTVHLQDFVLTNAEQYYYKVEAFNSCGKAVKTSNFGRNIIVRGSADETAVSLEWTSYESFSNGVQDYDIFRKNQYGEFDYVSTVPAESTSFSEDIRNAGYSNLKGAFSYYIEALEYGTSNLSKSNEVTVSVSTNIFMPNAFTPNGDELNDSFLPILDFFPREYKMIIYDRSGQVLFHSVDPAIGWDGSMNGSGKATEGVYVFHVEYSSYDGVRKSVTGNVTLLYPPQP